MNQRWSNGSTRIRSAGPLIFECAPKTFDTVSLRHREFRALIGWTVDENNVGKYEKLAPLLFKDYHGNFDSWKIFRNPILFRVSHFIWFYCFNYSYLFYVHGQTYGALVRGLGTIKGTFENGQFVKNTSHKNIEKDWGIRRITAGVIATAAIYVSCFVMYSVVFGSLFYL